MRGAEMFSQKPYTHRRIGLGWFSDTWIISFDDCPIREFTGPASEVKDIVFLLNAAYCNGYASGTVFGQMEPTKVTAPLPNEGVAQ